MTVFYPVDLGESAAIPMSTYSSSFLRTDATARSECRDKSGCQSRKWMLVDPEGIMTHWSVNTIELFKYKYIFLFNLHFIAAYSDSAMYSQISPMAHSTKSSTHPLPSIPLLPMKFNFNASGGIRNLTIEAGIRHLRRKFPST